MLTSGPKSDPLNIIPGTTLTGPNSSPGILPSPLQSMFDRIAQTIFPPPFPVTPVAQDPANSQAGFSPASMLKATALTSAAFMMMSASPTIGAAAVLAIVGYGLWKGYQRTHGHS